MIENNPDAYHQYIQDHNKSWKEYIEKIISTLDKKEVRKKQTNETGINALKEKVLVQLTNSYVLKKTIENIQTYQKFLEICISQLERFPFTVHSDFCYNDLVEDMVTHIISSDANFETIISKYMELHQYKDSNNRYYYDEFFIVKNTPIKLLTYYKYKEQYYFNSEYIIICKSVDKGWNIFYSIDKNKQPSNCEKIFENARCNLEFDILKTLTEKHDKCKCPQDKICDVNCSGVNMNDLTSEINDSLAKLRQYIFEISNKKNQ